MCGILGLTAPLNFKFNFEKFITANNLMLNRGPDCEGYLFTNNSDAVAYAKANNSNCKAINIESPANLALGHRRLAITDLSDDASQPMTESTGRYWIVYNGQIYNHIELRKELEKLGYNFKTDHSDTEVILNAYACWGINCLEKLNGTWAFSIWDSFKNTILLARDRLGVRPLFYYKNDSVFCFSSNLNSILELGLFKPKVSNKSIYNYLTYSHVPAPNTIYEDVYKLKAAHYIYFDIDANKVIQKRYWQPYQNIKINKDITEREAQIKFKDILTNAINIRLKADVNSGVLLSGGVDSSTIVALADSNTKLKTFSVGFENNETYKNELLNAKKIANLFETDHTELIVNKPEFFNTLNTVALLQDEPVSDTANLPLYLIAQIVKKNDIKVLLAGEGSDELLVGYEHWRMIYEYEKIFLNKPKLASFTRAALKFGGLKNKGQHYHKWLDKTKNNYPTFWSGTDIADDQTKKNLFTPDALQNLYSYSSFNALKEVYDEYNSFSEYNTIEWMRFSDFNNRLPDGLLARLDKMMMNSSIVIREPFLDYQLISFINSLPVKYLVSSKIEKKILKKSMEGILPNEIIYRKKDSFTVPLTSIYSENEDIQQVRKIIREFNAKENIFSDSFINSIDFKNNISLHWAVYNLALWFTNNKYLKN